MKEKINVEITLSKLLDESLEEAARNNRRKKDKEIVHRLIKSFDAESPVSALERMRQWLKQCKINQITIKK